MRLKIEIEMDNVAFEGREGIECSRILYEFARAIEDNPFAVAGVEKFLYDVNGNHVGKAKVTK